MGPLLDQRKKANRIQLDHAGFCARLGARDVPGSQRNYRKPNQTNIFWLGCQRPCQSLASRRHACRLVYFHKRNSGRTARASAYSSLYASYNQNRRNQMISSLRWLDLAVILLYMGAMAAVGLWFARRQTSTETYFVAKRSIPHWAMGVSIYAALISSITFIAYPGSAYAGNWNELVPGFMVLGVLILVGLVIIPFFRHAVGMSAYEYFEKRFC